MAYKIVDIEGIGPAYGDKLAAVGIKTTADFLKRGATAKGRKGLAVESGISAKLILKWVNHADLMRISGVGPEYAELLEGAGVDTVRELRRRNAENLAAKMEEVHAAKKLTRKAPTTATVTKWVEAAKSMEPVVSY